MTWPITPLTTYVATITQVKSADLNAIQAAINVLHAPRSYLGAGGDALGTGVAVIAADGSITTPTAGQVMIPLPLPVGMKVGTIGFWCGATGVPNYSFLSQNEAAGGATSYAGSVGTVVARELVTLSPGHTILAGETYYAHVIAAASTVATIFMVVVTPAA